MYYGVDSGTSSFPIGAPSKDFYIGRIGRDVTANLDYYNKKAANLATKKYGYWFLYGPASDPNYSSRYTTALAYNWGKSQAIAACTAWSDYRSSLGLKRIIFGDVEWNYSEKNTNGERFGWLLYSENSKSYTHNYSVLKGFVDHLNVAKLYSGCYSSPGCWESIMGTSNSPKYATYLWTAGNYTSAFNTPPSSLDAAPTINGYSATIWQCYGGDKDADIASSLPD